MRSRLFKFAVFFLVLVFSLSLLSGCDKGGGGSGETTTTTKATTKSTASGTTAATTAAPEKPTKLKVFLRNRWSGVDFDNFMVEYIQEKTNTEWEIIVGTDLVAQLNVLFASKDIPDLLTFPGDDNFERQMVNDGILLPLDEHLDKAPNLYERRKNIWDLMKHDDGHVYSINCCYSVNGGVDILLTYRKDWLDKLGFDIPETIDEYIAVADAVSNRDPDGDNQKNTFAMGGSDYRYHQHVFAAYGVFREYWLEYNGELVSGWVHPNMREALRTMRHLYEIGAIDPEWLTDDWNRTKAKFVEGVYGAMSYSRYIFDTNNTNDYYAPFKANNPDGELVYALTPKGPGYSEDVNFRGLSPRGWVRNGVYAGTKELDAVMRVIDWMSTEEGQMTNFYGIEGQHYIIDDNGVVVRLVSDEGMKQLGLTQCYIVTDWLELHSSPESMAVTEFGAKYATYSKNDGLFVEESQLYETDLNEYCKNQVLRIILGDVPVDEGFDEMLREWDKRGGKELTAAYNKAYQARK